MRKSLFFILVLLLTKCSIAFAQAYNPEYKDFSGVTAMTLPNGWYYGLVENGYPSGEGYAYYKDSKLGWVMYKGNFVKGRFSGKGDFLCKEGFVHGEWESHKLNKQINVNQEHIKQSCKDMQDVFRKKILTKYDNLAEITLPGGSSTWVEQISSDNMLGRKILKRISRK